MIKICKSYRCFGVFLAAIAAIPVWTMIISPHLLELSENFTYSADVVSTDNFYDAEKELFPGAIYSKTRFYYEATETVNDDTLLIRNVFDVRTPDNEPIFAVERNYAIDRYTSAHVPELGDARREGYLFGPRGAEYGKPFTYWHVNYDGPATMRFVGEEELYGLNVYHYETNYEGTAIDQTDNLGYLPGVGETRGVRLDPHLELWIEPETGWMVKYQDTTLANYYDLRTGEVIHPWNEFANTLSEQSVEEQVANARFLKVQTRIVESYIPFALFIIAGIFLLRWTGLLAVLYRQSTKRALLVVGSASVGILAMLAFAGWPFQNEILVHLIPGSAGMNPLTALCFAGLSAGMLLRIWRQNLAVSILGIALMAIAILRIAGDQGLIDVQIDLLLFRESVLAATSPSRMSLYTSISLLLLATILATSVRNVASKVRLVDILPMIVVLLSSITLFAYLFDVFQFLASPIFFSAAIHTALMYLISGIIIYALYHEHDVNERIGGWLAVSFVLFVSVLATVAFVGLVERNFSKDAETQFQEEVDRTVDELSARLNIYTNALQAGKGFFASSELVERDEWTTYVNAIDIQENYPGIQGLGYAIFVQPQDLQQHVASIRAEGFPEYSVRPEGEREIYTAIVYLEPFDIRNRQAFGFDMYQEPVRRLAMQRARDEAEPRISGRIILVQEIDDDVQAGFLIYAPFYGQAGDPGTVEGRRESIIGYVYSPFRARDFVEGVIGIEGIDGIAMGIYDGVGIVEDAKMYDDHQKKLGEGQLSRFHQTRTLFVAGRPWTLVFSSVPGYGQTSIATIVPLLLLAVGIATSVLIAGFFHMLISSRKQAIKYADEVTLTLRQKVDELRVQKRSLSESEQRFRGAFETSPVGIALVSLEGKWIKVNKALSDIVGYSPRELMQKTFQDITHKEDLDSDLENVQKLLQGEIETYQMEKRYVHKMGYNVWVLLSVSLVKDAHEKPLYFVSQIIDITERKRVENAKSEFISLASHQLRTPLTAIKWIIEAFQKGKVGKLTKQQGELIEDAHKAAMHMSESINAMLMLSRIEAGKIRTDYVEIGLDALLKEITEEQQKHAATKGQAITLECRATITLQSDKALLKEIIGNLLSNAIKYTPAKGKIIIQASKEGENIEVAVTDSGLGIPAEDQHKIFTKFFRAKNVTSSDTEGTGLGLYLVHSLVSMLGGSIRFESEENKGTTFYVTLPPSPPSSHE